MSRALFEHKSHNTEPLPSSSTLRVCFAAVTSRRPTCPRRRQDGDPAGNRPVKARDVLPDIETVGLEKQDEGTARAKGMTRASKDQDRQEAWPGGRRGGPDAGVRRPRTQGAGGSLTKARREPASTRGQTGAAGQRQRLGGAGAKAGSDRGGFDAQPKQADAARPQASSAGWRTPRPDGISPLGAGRQPGPARAASCAASRRRPWPAWNRSGVY